MHKLPYPRSKRALDLALAVPVAILAAPLIAGVAVAIRLTMGRPVLFRQIRPGLGGELFPILKFRTMRDRSSAADGDPRDAERITRLGKVLRSTSLDELPTLWNVIRGDMSLVGPRPLLPEYLPLYTARQARRHEVPPGVTGWAQVNGRNAITWEEKFEHDVWYVENRSLLLDLKILLLTARKVVAREGVSQEGRATVDYFRGSPHTGGGGA